MSNSFGTSLKITLFGESRGKCVGIIADGLAPGICVNASRISEMLTRRRPAGDISSARREPDVFEITSGVLRGKTTGAPLCVVIPNEDADDTVNGSGEMSKPRPGHADLAAHLKYNGFEDFRGGGMFSGRLTAPLAALGGVIIPYLEEQGILIGTHILTLAEEKDRGFNSSDLKCDIAALHSAVFPVLDSASGIRMKERVIEAKQSGDSVGGVLESAIINLPAGMGEPWFDSFESIISHLLFSIPGVKGVEFGDGFGFAEMFGSIANDDIAIENGKYYTKTNHNGGINGGITNGMPVIFRCAIKPTPSISKTQQTVDLDTGRECKISVQGRHDPTFIHRVAPVVDSIAAIAIYDLLSRSGKLKNPDNKKA